MPKIETAPWDGSKYLDTPEAVEEYLIAAFETGDPELIVASLGDIARLRSISELAERCGMPSAALRRVLSGKAEPEFATIMKLLGALNFTIVPKFGKAEEEGER